MTVAAMTVADATRRLLILTALRWLPVGLTLGVTVLLPLERGLSIAAIGSLLAIQGFVALALELPTGALSDTVGRRPVLVVAGILAVAASALYLVADGYGAFAVSLLLQGVFRALDSGSLESWFVDTVHEHGRAVDLSRPLAHAGTVLGAAIALGALAGGLLVAWHPVTGRSALALPLVVAIALYVGYTGLVALLVRDPQRPDRHPLGQPEPGRPAAAATGPHRGNHARALRGVPRTIADGARLVSRSGVLAGLLLVEVFWSVAMIAFETLTPLQLEGMLGSEQAAAAVFGPASAAAWVLFAGGSLLASRAARRLGIVRVAILARILNGVFVVAMGLAAGLAGLLVGYGLAYLAHGAAGPMHATLLHRQAGCTTRATVLSLNSMVAGGAYSLGLLALTALAGSTSTAAAVTAAGAFSIVGAACYLPALRQERALPGHVAGRGAR